MGLLWLVVPLGILMAFVHQANRPVAGMVLMVLVVQLFAWMYLTHLKSRFLLPIVVPLALLAGLAAEGSGTGRNGLILGGLRVLFSTGVAIHAVCTVFLLLPEVGLLGGPAHAEGKAPPPQASGQLLWRRVNVAALAARAESHASREALLVDPPPERSLVVGDSTAWRFAGDSRQIVYSTVFDRSLLQDVLAQQSPAAALAFLQHAGIHYVLLNWTEINRLRETYGLDDSIGPSAGQRSSRRTG